MADDVLYIEDDQDQRELGKLFLEKEGYTVHIHEDPEEALDCYQGEPVVVTDYLFDGETTGIDVAHRLNGETEAVILHTGYERGFVETDSQENLGQADLTFLQKGGGYDELVSELERLERNL